jgi:hypothetical protein
MREEIFSLLFYPTVVTMQKQVNEPSIASICHRMETSISRVICSIWQWNSFSVKLRMCQNRTLQIFHLFFCWNSQKRNFIFARCWVRDFPRNGINIKMSKAFCCFRLQTSLVHEGESCYVSWRWLRGKFEWKPKETSSSNHCFPLFQKETQEQQIVAREWGRVKIFYIISFREPSECIAKTDIHIRVYRDTQW